MEVDTRRLIALAVALALLGAVTWLAANRVQSPNQIAANAVPPAPEPVVATLMSGYLHSPITLSTIARSERIVSVNRPSALVGVVTFSELVPGDILEPGSLILRANGRPVFVIEAPFPFYRDFGGGDTGDDVRALQEGLQDAGYSTGRDRAGFFGAGTKAALTRLYLDAGYDPPNNDVAIRSNIAELDARIANGDSSEATQSERDAAISQLGARALAAEILAVPTLPISLNAVVAHVGLQLETLPILAEGGAGTTRLTATLPASSVSSLAQGAQGLVTDDSGAPVPASLDAIDPPTPDGQVVVTLSVTGQISLGGQYVVHFDNPANESAEAILAPAGAVVHRGGRDYIYVRDGAVFKELEIAVAGSLGGVVAISAVKPTDALSAGMDVRIG